MKIGVMIMAVNAQPSLRNVDMFIDTVVAYQNENKDKFKNEYEFFVYWSEYDKDNISMSYEKTGMTKYENLHHIVINEEEGVYRTYEKTIKAFISINGNYQDIDLFVRINISMFLNIDLLDAAVDKLKPGNMYCNAINSYVNGNSEYVNDLYGRGDLLIFDKGVMEKILEVSNKYMYCDLNLRERNGIDHVDDCILGLCFIDAYGKDYYKRLYMLNYNYIPGVDIDVNHIAKYAIGSRVKTVPPGVGYSGYSWDDNEWRLRDGEKMKQLMEYYKEKNFNYSDVKFSDVLVDKKNSRPTLFVQMGNVNVYNTIWKFLESKR